MALDLEEQEQVEELKAWWKLHGGFIAALVLAVAVGFAGWQGWRWYQASQAAQASDSQSAFRSGQESALGQAYGQPAH